MPTTVNCEVCKLPKVDTDLFAYYHGKGVCQSCVNDRAGLLIGSEMKEMESIIAVALKGGDVNAAVQSALEKFRNVGNPGA